MPYFAGLKNVACSAIRNSTAYVRLQVAEHERDQAEAGRDDLERLA